MDIMQTLGSDGALLVFLAAGLVATTIAIFHDTRTQATEVAKAGPER